MLFDHQVRWEWSERVPAIVHLDGTARLQTVSKRTDPVMNELLGYYFTLTGIPLLCNTSANLNGSGFFPDAASAISWANTSGVRFVWAEGVLWTRDADAAV